MSYAVKAFSKEEILEKKSRLESLRKEIILSQKMNHENLVKFQELHETRNSVYLIYELLKGNPIFKTSLPLTTTTEEIRTIMQSLLKGIKYLKDQNIVHRDLKPYNIIYKNPEDLSSLKIIDFGLSCPRFDASKPLKICGTPGFIAPEVFYASSLDGWKILDSNIDVFSAGVIFHYFLFGKLIYEERRGEPDFVYENNKQNLSKIGKFEEMRESVNNKNAYDLMRRMLEVDHTERISIEEALNHPFINQEDQFFDLEIPDDPVHNLSRKLKMKQFVSKDNKKLFMGSFKKENKDQKDNIYVMETKGNLKLSGVFSSKEVYA